MEIIIEAVCDNYDRIGKVFLSLIEKGYPYHEDIVWHIKEMTHEGIGSLSSPKTFLRISEL